MVNEEEEEEKDVGRGESVMEEKEEEKESKEEKEEEKEENMCIYMLGIPWLYVAKSQKSQHYSTYFPKTPAY